MNAVRIRGATLAGLLCVTTGSAAAAAAGETVRLSWVRGAGAESCLDAAALVARVETRLGRDAISDSASRSIEGVVVRDGDRFVAHIYVRGEAGALLGQREIDDASPSCGALDAAVVLAVALAIDPDAALAPPPPAAAPGPANVPVAAPPSQTPSQTAPLGGPATPPPAGSAPALAPAPPPLAPPLAVAFPPRAAPPRSDPPFVVGQVRALFAAGLLPSGAFGVASGAEAGVGRLRGTAGVLWFPEVRTTGRSFGFGLAAGSLGGCFDPYRSSLLRFGLCASALAGAVHAVTYSLTPTNPGDRAWAAASVAGRVELRAVGPLLVHTGVEAVIPFTRYRFLVVGRASPVFEPAPVAAVASLGVGMTIP